MQEKPLRTFGDAVIELAAIVIPATVAIAIGVTIVVAGGNLTNSYFDAIRFQPDSLKLADILAFIGNIAGGVLGAGGAYLVFRHERRREDAERQRELDELSQAAIGGQPFSFFSAIPGLVKPTFDSYCPGNPIQIAAVVISFFGRPIAADPDVSAEFKRRINLQARVVELIEADRVAAVELARIIQKGRAQGDALLLEEPDLGDKVAEVQIIEHLGFMFSGIGQLARSCRWHRRHQEISRAAFDVAKRMESLRRELDPNEHIGVAH